MRARFIHDDVRPIAIAAIAFRARRRFDLVAMEVEQQRQITGSPPIAVGAFL
jgi:hypothetical protein